MRAQLVADARGRTLEIGAGSGLNLAHYPERVTELVLSEPSLHMLEQLRSQIRVQPPRVSSWELVQAGAEGLPFDNGSFDSGSIAGPQSDGYGGTTAGQTYNHVFATPGTFRYHCSVHPTQMSGVLVVTP